MFLRKLIVAICPLAICGLVCGLFRWLDGMMGSTAYGAFVIKGALLGAALALTLPIAGVKAYTNGLSGWLLLGAGLMAAVLLYQYLETTGAVSVPVRAAVSAGKHEEAVAAFAEFPVKIEGYVFHIIAPMGFLLIILYIS